MARSGVCGLMNDNLELAIIIYRTVILVIVALILFAIFF